MTKYIHRIDIAQDNLEKVKNKNKNIFQSDENVLNSGGCTYVTLE